jgi:DNA-binding XRE family transcriptional regulator
MPTRSTPDRPIAAARADLGISQVHLARLVDIDPRTIRRIERGEQSPSVKTALRIAAALGTPVTELFPDTDA